MIPDDGLWGTPLCERVPKDVEDTRKMLPLKAARPDNSPTIAIKN